MRHPRKKLIVGLTGGICSGKSEVCKLFSKLGITVLDADNVARLITQTGTPCYEKIVKHFGDTIKKSDGALDRSKLKNIIFQHAAEKKWLEELLHPEIWLELERQAAIANASYIIAEIPLLIEVNSHPMIDRVLVVDADPLLQLRRIQQRDRISLQQAQNILGHQVSREERLSYADDVILNDSDFEHLAQQVAAIHERYLSLSSVTKK